MNLFGRLRRGGSVLVLLMAVLLVAPMVDCALLGDDAHAHASVTSAAELLTHSALEDHVHGVIDSIDDHCGPHIAHCIVKSVPPGGAQNIAPLLFFWVMIAVALVVAVPPLMVGRGVRGPPPTFLSCLDGRDILTRFCIARR